MRMAEPRPDAGDLANIANGCERMGRTETCCADGHHSFRRRFGICSNWTRVGGGYGWSVPPETDESDVADRQRLLDAMAVLHEVIEAPELLERLDAEDRAAFFNAAGDVFCPDPDIRRRRTKLLQQQRRSDRARRDDEMLSQTGIRTLRSKPVFTTPDVFAPSDVEQQTVADDPAAPPFRETMSDQHCYICKSPYREIHHFYDQLCADCAALNYAKRSELADMTGMVVLLTGGRVKIGYQAGDQAVAMRGRTDRRHALPSRCCAAVCGRTGFR